MTSEKPLNPMPANKTDEELANECANHLLDKTEKLDQSSPPLAIHS